MAVLTYAACWWRKSLPGVAICHLWLSLYLYFSCELCPILWLSCYTFGSSVGTGTFWRVLQKMHIQYGIEHRNNENLLSTYHVIATVLWMYFGSSFSVFTIKWFTYSWTSSGQGAIESRRERSSKQVSESKDTKFLPCRCLDQNQNRDGLNLFLFNTILTCRRLSSLTFGDTSCNRNDLISVRPISEVLWCLVHTSVYDEILPQYLLPIL